MPNPSAAGRHRALYCAGAALGAALLLTALTAIAWPPPPEGRPPAATDARDAAAAATPSAAPAAHQPQRSPATPPPSPAAADREPDFTARIRELVALGRETAALAQADEIAAARATDARARERFAALLVAYPDTGERALAAATVLPGAEPPDPDEAAHRVVLQLALAAELARRHGAAADAGLPPLAPLVQAVLDVLPQRAWLAELATAVLGDQPYLQLPHEPSVLGLLRLAGDGLVPRPVATRLLLTLWHNLQQSGARTSVELARLAMLWLDDRDPSQRTAACRHLLADPRHRPLVLAWLRERGDREVAHELATFAAQDLPPADALAVLREVAPLLPRATHAYLVLGHRAPAEVASAYRELLAADTHPAVRSDLVAGLGMQAADEALAVARLALQADPSPAVRVQAAFALTANPATLADEREQVCHQLLDDPRLASDATALGGVVHLLHNLEANGLVNALDRLGQRLRTLPLPEEARHTLEEILRRSLPGGGSR